MAFNDEDNVLIKYLQESTKWC